MSEPKFSKKVEATLRASLANPDKDVSLYIRSPGSSDREKLGHLLGRRLIIPEDSNCAGYIFTYDEWMSAVRIGDHYHLRIEQHDFHNILTRMSQSLKKTRRVTKRIMQYIRDGFRIRTKKTKQQERIVELEKQLVQEKKEKNSLRKKIASYKGMVADLSTVGYGNYPLPPTDLYAISFLKKVFDSVAVYVEDDDEGNPCLMIDLLEGNYSSQGRPEAWTESQILAKEALQENRIRLRLLTMHDNGENSESPYYNQRWNIAYEIPLDSLN